jgi:CubicO group peptidase (beta-lactamase class C family)
MSDRLAPITDPTAVGLSGERLDRIAEHFQQYIDRKLLPGWLIAVSRHGQLAWLRSAGHADVEASVPVSHDTVWRIYSMTKPITTVAAMRLYEQGRFELTDPVHRLIDSFRNLRVWRSGSVTNHRLDPVTEPMRIWHLMTHTSGLTYGFLWAHPVDELYRRAGFEWGVPPDTNLAGVVDRLSELPLVFQPGTEWNYSMATDVLGRVIEVITGSPLDEALRELVFDPLGMTETGFSAQGPLGDRLAALYAPMPGTQEIFRIDQLGEAARHEPTAFMGGGGLVSTMADYLRFADMLRRGGISADGQRLLSPRTVAYMTANHLPGGADLTAFGRPLFSETTFDGVGFGLGFSVTIDPITNKVLGSMGDFGWGGAASTTFWVDPVDDVTAVFMTQLLPSSTHPLRSQLKQLVQQAIVE